MNREEWRRLEDVAHRLRSLCMSTVATAGSGHIGGSMSAMDVLTVLFHRHLNFSAATMHDPGRDRFVLSKGHIAIGFTPVLADLGCFPVEWLATYNQYDSPLGMHPDAKKLPGVEVSTGSLGHGLPIALGMALGARVQGADWRTYCLLGDGECNEGSVWEAAMAAAHYRADNLVAIVDRNRAMIDGPTEEVMSLEPLAAKWEAFGWHTLRIDGHHLPSIAAALEEAGATKGRPTVIVAETVKGEGIDFIAGDYRWHYGSFDAATAERAQAALAAHHERRLAAVASGAGPRDLPGGEG